MRVATLLLTAMLTGVPGVPLEAQQYPSEGSPPPDVQVTQEPTDRGTQGGDAAPPAQEPEAPVSIDRIREGLARPGPPLLQRLDRRADFRTQVLEEQKIEAIIASLDLKSGPPPAGGLYHYEQQRFNFNPVDRPLMQPYAAFSGGELLTLAIENFIREYLGGALVDAVASSRRERAEDAAKAEVARSILAYCAAQPNGGSGILICDNPSVAR
jgi:hypothetical protein